MYYLRQRELFKLGASTYLDAGKCSRFALNSLEHRSGEIQGLPSLRGRLVLRYGCLGRKPGMFPAGQLIRPGCITLVTSTGTTSTVTDMERWAGPRPRECADGASVEEGQACLW